MRFLIHWLIMTFLIISAMLTGYGVSQHQLRTEYMSQDEVKILVRSIKDECTVTYVRQECFDYPYHQRDLFRDTTLHEMSKAGFWDRRKANTATEKANEWCKDRFRDIHFPEEKK